MPKLKIIECPRDAMQSIKKFIPTEKKIKYVVTGGAGFIGSNLVDVLIEKNFDIDIAVDGGIKVENSNKVIDAGANVLISGTGIFNYGKGAKSAISELRNSKKQ